MSKARNLIQAAETIERLSVQQQDMVIAAAALKEIGSLENAKEEADQAKNTAHAERDAALQELDQAKADVKAQKQRAEDIVLGATAKADGIIKDATAQAGKLTDEAVSQAKRIRQDEIDTREKALKNLNEKIATATETLEHLSAQTLKARDDAAAAQQLQAEAEAGLAKVEKQIEKLSSKVSA